MLLQFAVENFLSFRDKTVFSMRAAANVERGPEAPDVVRGSDIARCAALYGANASGKSNFIKALELVREMVVKGVPEDESIGVRSFQLADETRKAPASFEVYLRGPSGKVYGYGFSATPDAVTREWASELRDGEESLIFERTGQEFEFAFEGEELQFLRNIKFAVRRNQLLLRTAKALNIEGFPASIRELAEWFSVRLVIVRPDASYVPLVEQVDADPEFRSFLGRVLASTDTGISELRVVRRELPRHHGSVQTPPVQSDGRRDDEDAWSNFPPWMTVAVEPDGAHYRISLRFAHAVRAGGTPVEFEPQHESDGTRRLLDLSPLLYLAARKPIVFVVDELDRSLHTALSRWLIERFVREVPASESQLIFTTHDTNLLDVEVLQPDAYWFAEKDEAGASTLYSLAEFKAEQVAQLRKNLEQAYLVGRFGGVPRLREGS